MPTLTDKELHEILMKRSIRGWSITIYEHEIERVAKLANCDINRIRSGLVRYYDCLLKAHS